MKFRSTRTNEDVTGMRRLAGIARPLPTALVHWSVRMMFCAALIAAPTLLLTGCEYAIPFGVSRHAKQIQATLSPEIASEILQKYLPADEKHDGLFSYDCVTVKGQSEWRARGVPIHAAIANGMLTFEANPDSDFEKIKLSKQSNDVRNEDATPSWFETSKVEINLRTVNGVVFWDSVHSSSKAPPGRMVELQWGDLEDAIPGRSSQRGTLTLHVQPGNVDELIAALRYFAPKARFVAAR